MKVTDCRDVWASWLTPIHEDIIELANHKYFYTQLREIVGANRTLHGESVVWAYLVTTWAHYAGAAIRRQVKIRDNAASMARLLAGIASTPKAVSRDWFVGRFAGRRSSPSHHQRTEAANRLFDEYAGAGRPFIDANRVKEDSALLRRVAAPVETYVDKLVAHHDMKPPVSLPTLGEIHAAVDLLVTLLEKYHRVVMGTTLIVGSAAAVGDEWKELFRIPWIPRLTTA